MKRMIRQWVSISLAIALLISLLPPTPAMAAATITITNMYTNPSGGGTNAPQDPNSVTRVTRNPFEIKASITNISASQINTLFYEITNTSTGERLEEKNKKAVMTSSSEITFSNVELTEGLNKIVIKMGDTGSLVSAPGWVYFTPATNLSEFEINNQPWDESKFYPETVTGTSTGLTIKGFAPNAKEVKAYLPGNTTAKNAFISNENDFYYPADINTRIACDSTSEICLQRGDNRIKFVSSNDTNSYQTEKLLIYNDGNPFAYNVKMRDVSGNANSPAAQTSDRYLVDLPQFVKPVGGMNLTFTARIKIDLVPAGAGAPMAKYTTTDLDINGTSLNLNLNNDTIAPATDVPITGTMTYSILPDIVTDTVKNQKFYTIEIKGIQDITPVSQDIQQFSFKFSAAGLPDIRSTYKFIYYDDTAPYVAKMTQVVGKDGATGNDIEVQLGDMPAVNEIAELPAKVKLYANGNTTALDLTVGSQTFTADSGSPAAVNGQQVFTYTLAGILDGTHTLTAIPKNGGTNGPTKTYNIRVTNAPYIIVTNITNNKTIEKLADLTCTVSGTPTVACLTGRVVNFKKSANEATATNYIEVHVNEKVTRIPYANIIDATGNFTFDLRNIATAYGIPATDFEKLMVEGINTIKFSIYVNGSRVTEASYSIFKFSTEAPSFTDIVPDSVNGTRLYTSAQNKDYFTTSERVVSFKGTYYNNPTKGGHSTITLKVIGKDAQGNNFTEYHTIGTGTAGTGQVTTKTVADPGRFFFTTAPSNTGGANNTSFLFNTYDIKLPDKGDIVFEFSVTNDLSQITAFKTITISRTPVPYVIKAPLLYKNEKNQDQASVNSNFYLVVIEAENADSVTIGKDNALKKTELDGSVYVDRYYYEVKNLKPGSNQVKFTVNRGSQKSDGAFILFNTNTPLEGAQYLTGMGNKLSAFNKEVELQFPKDTKLKRLRPNNRNNEFITVERNILFGIADSSTGRVDKSNTAFVDEYASSRITRKVTENTFRTASKLYYIDAGFIGDQSTPEVTIPYLEDGLKGRGIEPFDLNASTGFFNRNAASTFVPTQRGEITLQFDPSIRDDAWKYITVMALTVDENLSGATDISWKNIGGVVDMKKNTIKVPFDKFGYYQVMYMDRGFNDMTDHAYARNELETMYSKGLMNSRTIATFSPSEPITRGEFTAMIVRIFDIPLNYEGPNTFGDVPKIETTNRLYNYKLVETAARAGIVRGLSNNIFSPESTLTRQDAAVMIARAADLKMNSDLQKAQDSLSKTFTDGYDVNIYAASAVEAITKAGFIEGRENVLLPGQRKGTVRFDPTMNMTRADTAVIAMRVLSSQKKVPR
ncbi:hypothetical protein ACVLD2_003992 [Paenibacillus sp. PvR052]|nr:hypothetical protein [Paenibacillus sp. PvP091]MBP1171444.1 hypothetical protein [Paenibacillus sp. PvR098]MBP2442472.1 hypothetical protein [Paenibacillus sp. PvP052]